ncbi:hypothetical protein N7454_009117 [Penicillium verhagenii]|nr:hypothetical protein N7454_009117 [Penicillium verhagenii]
MEGKPDSPRWRFRFTGIFSRASGNSQDCKSDGESEITLVSPIMTFITNCGLLPKLQSFMTVADANHA